MSVKWNEGFSEWTATDRGMVDREGDCPGCYHNEVLTTECGVYKDYGKGKHWFIQPVQGDEDLVACDFCGGRVAYEEELDGWEEVGRP